MLLVPRCLIFYVDQALFANVLPFSIYPTREDSESMMASCAELDITFCLGREIADQFFETVEQSRIGTRPAGFWNLVKDCGVIPSNYAKQAKTFLNCRTIFL